MRAVPWDEFLAFMGDMYRIGQPLPCVLSLGDDQIPVFRYRAVSPSTLIFQRVRDPSDGGLNWTTAEFKRRWIDADPARQGADWYVTNNEVNRWDTVALQYWWDEMQWCIAHQFPITIFNWAVGNPGGPELDVWGNPMIVKILRLIRDTYRADGRPLFALNLHQYDLGDIINCDWTGKDDIQRWLKTILHPAAPAKSLLPQDLQDNPPWLVHTEKGQQWGSRLTEDQLLAKLRNDQAIGEQQKNFIGNCDWAFGHTGENAGENFVGDNIYPLRNAYKRLYGVPV